MKSTMLVLVCGLLFGLVGAATSRAPNPAKSLLMSVVGSGAIDGPRAR